MRTKNILFIATHHYTLPSSMPQTREYTALAVLIATIAAASCVHADAPDFCRDLDCPKFKVVEQTDDYELRSYAPGAWVRDGQFLQHSVADHLIPR